MANRYWVGGGSSANWNATANTNWGTASNTRDNASVPGSSDDCFFDNSANGNSPCTVNTAPTVKSINFTSVGAGDYANTLSGSSGITCNSGNLTFSSAMTNSWTGGITFTGTSGTQTLTPAGKVTANSLTMNGAGGTGTVADNITTTGNFTLTAGTFNTANKSLSFNSITSSNTNTRVLTLGSSAITCLSALNFTDATNLTITANTATVTLNGNGGAGNHSVNGGGANFNGMSITLSTTGVLTLGTSMTGIKDFIVTDVTNACDLRFDNGSYITCTGTITYNGSDYRALYTSSWLTPDPVPTTPTFGGVTQVERIGGGALKISWTAGTDLTGYRIYAKPSNATNLFTSTYLVKEVPSGVTSTILKTGADNTTFFDGTAAIYVGVRAYNVDGNCTTAGTGVEDTNTTSYYITPDGTGSTYIKIPQELWSL